MTTVVGEVQLPSDNIAAYPLDCANDTYSFVSSLRQLPAGMPAVLGEGGALADRNEDFNGTDAMRANLSSNRFAGAAVGHKRIFAVVEHGGILLVTDYWAFELVGSRWIGNRRWNGSPPATLKDVLSVACKQYAPRRHARVAGLQIDCSFGQSHLTTLRYEGAGRRGNFELRPWNRAQWWLFALDGITDAGTNLPASSRQLTELRTVLDATRPAMNWDYSCRYEVDVFRGALDSGSAGVTRSTPARLGNSN